MLVFRASMVHPVVGSRYPIVTVMNSVSVLQVDELSEAGHCRTKTTGKFVSRNIFYLL